MVIWTSRSFFSDRFLVERIRRSENKDRKVKVKKISCKLCLMPNRIIKKHSILHRVCGGK